MLDGEAQVKTGSFSNTSDYICYLIRQDHERAVARSALQLVICEAIASGNPEPFDFTAFKARMHEQYDAK